jgi:hypothetical protein
MRGKGAGIRWSFARGWRYSSDGSAPRLGSRVHTRGLANGTNRTASTLAVEPRDDVYGPASFVPFGLGIPNLGVAFQASGLDGDSELRLLSYSLWSY